MSITNKQLSFVLLTTVLFLSTPIFVHAEPGFIASTMYQIVQKFFGLFFILAGYLLNFSIQDFIIDFGSDFKVAGGVGEAVNLIWLNIRDIFNLTFIFGLVYIGFKMILGTDDSQSRRWLAHLILAALLVNFSLYITKFIVDFTNLLATQIAVGGFPNAGLSKAGAIDIAGTFMNSMGITSLVGNGAGIPTAAGDAPWGYIFGTIIILLTGTFVFAAGAFLLTIRYASLLIYMIFSPLMFIGWVLPQLQSVSDKYWKGFLVNAFFAPVYIFMLYVSSTIIYAFYGGKVADFGSLTNPDSAADLNGVFESTLPPFIVSSILLVASVVLASKMGSDGAGAAMKMGQRFRGAVQRRAGSMTAGAAGGLARNTAGRYANHLANSKKFKDRAGSSFRGKLALQAARGVAGSSFDARQVGNIGKEIGVGSGKTGGYAKTEKDKIKSDKDFSDSLGKKEAKQEDIEKATSTNTDVMEAKAKVKEQEEKNAENESALEKGGDGARAKAQEKVDEIKNRTVFSPTTAQELQEAEKELSDVDTKLGADMEVLKKEVDAGKKALDKANNDMVKIVDATKLKEEAKIVYGRQIDYANQVQNTANLVELGVGKFKGTSRSSASAEKLKESLGTDASGAITGTKMMNSDSEYKKAQVRARADKELADAGSMTAVSSTSEAVANTENT